MRVAITSSGKGLEASVDKRFARCRFIVFVDLDSMRFDSVENAASVVSSGAGAPAAYLVKNRGADAVLTGHVGPTAAEILLDSGIQVYTGIEGCVRDAVQMFNDELLHRVESATVSSGFGLG